MSIKVLDLAICQAIDPQIFVTTHPRSAPQIQELVYSTNACMHQFLNVGMILGLGSRLVHFPIYFGSLILSIFIPIFFPPLWPPNSSFPYLLCPWPSQIAPLCPLGNLLKSRKKQ
jgi:hypothetical protein